MSTKFYEDLGFEVNWKSDDLTEIKVGEYAFLLQNYYQEDWASNFMLQLMVEDLNAWWEHIQINQLESNYPGVKTKAPEDYPWGLREIHLIDPSGVLWHIVQK